MTSILSNDDGGNATNLAKATTNPNTTTTTTANNLMAIDSPAIDLMAKNNTNNNVMRAEDLFAKAKQIEDESIQDHPSVQIENNIALSYDLGNLTMFDPSPIDFSKLAMDFNFECRDSNGNNIPPFNKIIFDERKKREEYLLNISRNNVQAIINKLFQLPKQKLKVDETGIVVKLPPPTNKFPRQKPMPDKKPQTRWEKFAERKNIRSSKRNKELLQWDENTQTWKKKWGFRKANNPIDDPIYEHKANDEDTRDPWTKMEKEKKKRVAINESNRLKNLKTAVGDRVPGTIDLQSALKHTKKQIKNITNSQKNIVKQGRRVTQQDGKFNNEKFGHLNTALTIAQHSTASMGKFDKLNHYEPKPSLKKNPKNQTKNNDSSQNIKKSYKISKTVSRNMDPENAKQHEIMFQMFGKQQKDAFNVSKAAKHVKYEIKRTRKRKSK